LHPDLITLAKNRRTAEGERLDGRSGHRGTGTLSGVRVVRKQATRERVLAICLKHLQRGLDDYASHGFAALHSEWQARHAWHGTTVRISGGGDDIIGLCHGVDIDGNLLLETPTGLRTVASGDVSLRRSEGSTA